MTDAENFAQVAETIARRPIRSEQGRWEAEFLEDNVHIPLLRRIVECVVGAVRERGLDPEEADAGRPKAGQNRYAASRMATRRVVSTRAWRL